MVTSLFIIGISAVMFVYWFRYTCLLLLNARQAHDFADSVVKTHHLGFRQIDGGLSDDVIDTLLRRDCRILLGLLRSIGTGYEVEVLVLRIDFYAMRLWWRFMKRLAPLSAAGARHEMTIVLENWATLVGISERPRRLQSL